jgi:hypothetical protein
LPVGDTQPARSGTTQGDGAARREEEFPSFGADIVGTPPSVLAATVKDHVARSGKLIKEVGIKED